MKKLVLNKETVATLSQRQQGNVFGGGIGIRPSMPQYGCSDQFTFVNDQCPSRNCGWSAACSGDTPASKPGIPCE